MLCLNASDGEYGERREGPHACESFNTHYRIMIGFGGGREDWAKPDIVRAQLLSFFDLAGIMRGESDVFLPSEELPGFEVRQV